MNSSRTIKQHILLTPVSVGIVCRKCKQDITTRDAKKAAVLAKAPAYLKVGLCCPYCEIQERIEARKPPVIDYQTYIRSDAWRVKATQAKERAGGRCQVCNGTERLQTHHRSYERLGRELPEDLTVLCDECHELFSKRGKLK